MASSTVIVNLLANARGFQSGIRGAQASIRRLQALTAGSRAATNLLGGAAKAMAASFATAAVAAGSVGTAAVASVGAVTLSMAALPALFAAIGVKAFAGTKAGSKALKELKSDTAKVFQEASKPFQLSITKAFKTLQFVINGLKPQLTSMYGSLAKITDALGGKLKANSKAFGDTLLRVFNESLPAFKAMLTGIGEIVKGFVKMVDIVAPSNKGVSHFIIELSKAIANVLPFLGQLTVAFLPLATQITKNITPVLDGLVKILTGGIPTATAFGAVLSNVVTFLTPAFQALGQVLPLVAKAFAGLIAGLSGGALAAIVTAIGNAVVTLAPSFTALLNAILPVIPTIISALVPAIQNLASILVSLTPVIDAVFGFFAKHPDLFTAIVLGGLAFAAAMKVLAIVIGIVEVATVALNIALYANPIGLVVLAVILLVAAFINAYKHSETFRNIVNKVGSALKEVAIVIGRLVIGAVNGLVVAFKAVIGFLKGLPGNIKNVFSGAGKFLYNAGRAIIQGLLNGITSLAKSVADKAKAIANTVKNAAKSALGIHSPSRVFLEIGQNVNKGLVNGLSNIAGVRKASAGLAKAVENNFGAPTLSAKAGVLKGSDSNSTTGQTVNINVTVPVGASAIDAGREIQKTLNKYYAAGGTRTA